jgi:hypothetical protein
MEALNLDVSDTFTSIDMDPLKKSKLRTRLIRHKGLNRSYVSIDQSGFDKNQNKKLVVYAIKKLLNYLSVDNHPDLKIISDVEVESLANVVLCDVAGGSYNMKWTKGLLSGYKLTAIIGSILNASAAKTVMDDYGFRLIDGVFQGDDAICVLDRNMHKEVLVDGYSKLGLTTNPSKTSISNTNFDFLHEFHINDRVHGLPARIFKSILWKKPLSMGRDYGISAFNNMVDTFRKGMRRGLNPIKILLRYVKGKLSNVPSNFNSLFQEYLDTSIMDGGFGIFSGGAVGISYKSEEKFKINIKINKLNLIKDNLQLDETNTQNIIYSRMKDLIPLPNLRSTIDLVRVNLTGEENLKTIGFQRLSRILARPKFQQLPRIMWVVDDLSFDKFAYQRKLRLQAKLMFRSGKIGIEDIPDKKSFYCVKNIDRLVRRLFSNVDIPVSMESVTFSGEYFSKLQT